MYGIFLTYYVQCIELILGFLCCRLITQKKIYTTVWIVCVPAALPSNMHPDTVWEEPFLSYSVSQVVCPLAVWRVSL